MSEGIVRYRASDGSEVKLTPGIVAKYVVTGGQQVDGREIYAFMARCQARHLNPLAGDAYMTAYYNKRTGRTEASVIVSKDYFVRTATQQPGFDGFRAGIVTVGHDGEWHYREGTIYGKDTEKLVGGWAEVHDKGRAYPSRAEVSLGEYDQHRSLWLAKPATMIRKVALVQALREAYPGAYGGLYDRDEMPEPPEPVAAQAARVEAEAAQAARVEAEAVPGKAEWGQADAEASSDADARAEGEWLDRQAGQEPEDGAPQPELADEDYEF